MISAHYAETEFMNERFILKSISGKESSSVELQRGKLFARGKDRKTDSYCVGNFDEKKSLQFINR